MGVGREASITLNIFVLFFLGGVVPRPEKNVAFLSLLTVYIGLLCVSFFLHLFTKRQIPVDKHICDVGVTAVILVFLINVCIKLI